MKNIHVLPTDKPTWLHKSTLTGVLRKSSSCINDMRQAQGMNIYITSDEEIKPNKYALINGVLCKTELLGNVIVSRQISGGSTMDICKSEYSEIILTTDKDLIKDGVQAIDDEFLEWFISKANDSGKPIDIIDVISIMPKGYKIIIPKKEQKQNLIDMMKADEELGLYEEPKQETLEDDFMVWDELFGILAWKFKPTKSGDMFLDAEKVFEELKSKFQLKKK